MSESRDEFTDGGRQADAASGGNTTPPDPGPPAGDDARLPADEPGLEEVEEQVAADIQAVLAERDEYLEALRRLQADFENFRKRIMKQEADRLARAAEGLVEKLLPVLDACDAALAHGAEDVQPVAAALFGALEKEGLERLHPVGKPFDPNEHEAVVTEPAGEGEDSDVVSEVFRAGYRWKGRVLRPAMVKVRG